jgi:hypothetical protein
MLYMIIEDFYNSDPVPVYRRLRDSGRQQPDGLTYRGSWVSKDLKRCYQLMECDDPELLDQWMSHWNDVMGFQVVPVITSADAIELVNPKL